MYVGRVVGMVVATRKDEKLVGKKLLVVQQIDSKGQPMEKEEVAVDSVGAGIGEVVLVSKGSSARYVFGPDTPIDAAIVGIVDNMEVQS